MIRFKVTWTGPMPRELRRRWPKIRKAAFTEIGEMWHKKFRPKHFTRAGAREYSYSPRAGDALARGSKRFRRSYTGQKLRRFGHTLPLVFSGASRDLTRLRDVRATGKGVRIVMRAPTLNFSRKGATKSMRDELTEISAREAKALTKRLARSIERGMAAIRTKRVVRA